MAELLEKLNGRKMRRLEKSRREVFEEIERAALKPLPARPFEYAEWSQPKVDLSYHVEHDNHFYSVHFSLIGEKVDLRATETTVEILRGLGWSAVVAAARSIGRNGSGSGSDRTASSSTSRHDLSSIDPSIRTLPFRFRSGRVGSTRSPGSRGRPNVLAHPDARHSAINGARPRRKYSSKLGSSNERPSGRPMISESQSNRQDKSGLVLVRIENVAGKAHLLEGEAGEHAALDIAISFV
jgi:hypothetical protein